MEKDENCCLAKILRVIDILQKECNSDCISEGCDRPFLGGGEFSIYNTRPITLYSRSGNLFVANYFVNNVVTTSSTFRVEDVKGCCAKLRILEPTEGGFNATNEFVTVNLECFCILRCLPDTSIEL